MSQAPAEVAVPPSVLAAQAGALKDTVTNALPEGADGTFIGFLQRGKNLVPAVLYVSNGAVQRVSTPYDTADSPGRPFAFALYDMQVLFQQVIRESQVK